MSLIERGFREKIVLVGVTVPPAREEQTERHLDELALLVDTAGADEVGRVLQRRSSPDPATYIGRGKAEELRRLSEALDGVPVESPGRPAVARGGASFDGASGVR